MTRIGRQMPHFEEIDLNSISAEFSADRKYRYVLTAHYRNSLLRSDANEQIAVVLKNPSSADAFKSDATIRKVETFVHKHFEKAKTLVILNIFALRATDASDVQQCFLQYGYDYITGDENNQYIAKVLKQSDAIICAWGGNSGIDKTVYNKRIAEVKSLLKSCGTKCYEVKSPAATNEPLHGLMWGYNYECVLFTLY